MNKTLFILASIAVIASATSAAAGGSTKGTGGMNGVAQTGLASERIGGSTKGTGGVNGVSQTGLSASTQAIGARRPQASMTVLSVALPAKATLASR